MTDQKSDDPAWEMTKSVINEDTEDEWKKRRAVPLLELNNQGGNNTSYFTMYDEGHTRILASLVPDEIIYNINDYSKREFDGCLLFGDVSGFTDLCEKYNKSGKGGPSRLTQVLNNYIGAMVQEIMSHGGDVLNFSGDAFIALWKVTDQLSLRDAVHEAIDCSLVIQKTYGTYHTDVDVVVRVKLAVASGHLVFSLLGNQESTHYLMTGDTIDGIKSAEAKSSAGEIVITARVSRHISANEYLIKVLDDGLHAKVLGVGPNWRNTQRQYEDKDAYSQFERDLETQAGSIASETSMASTKLGAATDDEEISPITTDQYALRPAVNHAARMKMKDDLRRFIIAPVVRGIDASEPLEYLTEIRQVAILFVNCKVNSSVGPTDGIDVADKVYLAVYSSVKDRYGCVNKISNFDKDLMLLIIFGLRGFKHELECQIALKCATECYEKIHNIQEIDEVAVAVTTGRCYCGAFGHTLRREYTVIGLVVNKAARLMIAYPNRVTCDKETFLYSKLEALNFLLQEYKPLKGIVNPGPVYEFKEVERTHDLAFSISPYPLLGRQQEQELYASLMKRARELTKREKATEQYFNMLIVRGDFRQGKTRLLEEILYNTDPSIPIHTFTLTAYDREVPFRAIQLMFLRFIGLPSNTSRSSRERKINVRLQKKNVEEDYFVLNPVFDVRFPVTRKIDNDEDELELLYKIFLMLAKCFTKFWIVAMDDADYIDDESWMLLQILLDAKLIFIIATMGAQKELTSYALKVLKNEHMKIIELKPIDKWYHVGLVCQMLNIEGIPPELEKTVQNRSNGNPGWIESFLVTLLQSGGLAVEEITRIRAYNMGVVIPPLYMLMRLSKTEIDLWMEIMEERTYKQDEESSKRWKIYVDSCRESYPNLTVATTFSELAKDRMIRVCRLDPNFNVDDVVAEQHMDVVILKTFDSLTSYEQLLLKCSSILGDIFQRDMLLYIMSSTATRLTALAVQKLFEIQVLSCARGNFLDGGLNFKDRLLDPNDDLTVKCDCIGLVIEDSCIDLPKYASCGYMRFRSSEFRETTYNLLTDNQKREFHGKAIRYMEKETRRCRACGSGYFTRYLGGGRLDESLRARHKPKKMSIVTRDSVDTHMEKSIMEKGSIRRSSNMSGSKGSSIRGTGTGTYLRTSGASNVESISVATSNFYTKSGFGLATIKRLKDNYNLVRTFSSYDYSQCTCLLVLSTMYSQLIEHCKGAGLVEKIMEATVEYSYVCMASNNATQAIKVLEEALQLLEGPMKDQLELEWMVYLKKAKLFTLLGQARMDLNDDDAYNFFIDALKYYGLTFPKSNVAKSLLKGRLKLKQNLRLYMFADLCRRRRIDEDLAEYCNNVAECLYLLYKYFSSKRMWKEAELAAVWSLAKAVQTESDFEILCRSYSSMINLATVTGQHKLCIALEVYSLRTCHRKKSIVEVEELKAIALLYYEIGRARFIRGEVDKAMQMGFPIWRISNAARCPDLLARCFPTLAYGTLLRKQFVEYGNILNELLYIVDQNIDNSERIWYHALCLTLHLETGFVAQTMEKCNQFIQAEAFEETVKDPTSKARLIVCKWLWEIRNENWEAGRVFQKQAWKFSFLVRGEKLTHTLTALYLLEGLIIFLVNKMDMKNLKVCQKTNTYINHLLGKMDKAAKTFPVIYPRLYHLKAYYIMAKFNDHKAALKLLKKAENIAGKQHNELELSWLQHSQQAWSHKLPPEVKYAWQERCVEGNTIQFNDVDFIDKVAQYSLPLPIYV